MPIRFADIEIDPEARELRRAGTRMAIEPKAFDLLVYLWRHRARVVTKQELLDALWPDQDVFENALAMCVHRARAAIGRDLIRNVPRRGYRLAIDAATDGGESPAAQAARAGHDAFASLDFAGAVQHYGRALELLNQDHAGGSPGRVSLLMGRGEALCRIGDQAGAREAFRQAQQLSRSDSGQRRAAAGDSPAEDARFLAMLRAAIEVAEEGHDAGSAAAVPQQLRALEDAIEQARLAGDLATLASVIVTRRWLAFSELPSARLPLSTEAVLLAETIDAPHLLQEARVLHVHDLFEHGRLDEANAQIDAHTVLAAELDAPVHHWSAAYLAATRAGLVALPNECDRLALDALGKGVQVAPEIAAAIYGSQAMASKARQGCLGETTGMLEMFVQRYPQQPVGHATLAGAYAETGRLEEARASVAMAMRSGFASGRVRDSLVCNTIAALSRACAALDDARRAATLFEIMLPWSGTHMVSPPAVAYLGPIDGFLGILARTAGDWGRAKQLFESAIDGCRQMQSEALRAHTLYEYACGLRQRGERSAPALLDEAARIASDLHLSGLAGWIAAQPRP